MEIRRAMAIAATRSSALIIRRPRVVTHHPELILPRAEAIRLHHAPTPGPVAVVGGAEVAVVAQARMVVEVVVTRIAAEVEVVTVGVEAHTAAEAPARTDATN